MLVGQLETLFPEAPQLSFAVWMAYAVPISGFLLLVCFATLRTGSGPAPVVDARALRAEADALGPLSAAEQSVIALLVATLVLWLTRHPVFVPGWGALFRDGAVSDATVIMATTILLFALPAGPPPALRGAPRPAPRLLDWATAQNIPWDVVLLLGGGFALAAGFADSGLSTHLACTLLRSRTVAALPLPALLVSICAAVTAMTELCSNVATCTIVLPILGTLAAAMHLDPRFLMLPAALSCSLAFMLPISTPANAIAFATGRLEIRDMAVPGAVLNAVGVAAIAFASLTYAKELFDMDPATQPEWALATNGDPGATGPQC